MTKNMRYNMKAKTVDIMMLLLKLSLFIAIYLNGIECVIIQGRWSQAMTNTQLLTSAAVTVIKAEKIYCSSECASRNCAVFEWNDGVCKMYESPIILQYKSGSVNMYTNTKLGGLRTSKFQAIITSDGSVFIKCLKQATIGNARRMCLNLDGNFKLITPSTRAVLDDLDYIISTEAGYYFTDLRKVGGSQIFGDGTLFGKSEVTHIPLISDGDGSHSVYAYDGNNFDDVYNIARYFFVCELVN